MGGPQGVHERVVRGDLEGGGVRLGGLQRALHPDPAVGQLCLRGVEANQPSGRRMPPVRGRQPEALVELVQLFGVEQHPDRPDLVAGEHLGIQRGPHDVVLGDAQRARHLTVREVRRPPRGRQRYALRADAELRGGALRVQPAGVGRAGHLALRGERDDGHPQGLGGRSGTGGALIGMPYTHIDRRTEGHGDQQDEDQRLPGQPAAQWWAAAHSGRVVGQALLRGELLKAGSTDERLVEDDGSVLVLATSGAALGCPLGWVARPSHTFRVGRGKLR